MASRTTTTMTVRLSPTVKKRLDRLTTLSQRTKSSLMAAAIVDFVDRELPIVEGIRRALEDAHAGRVVPHKAAMRRLRQTVARAARDR